MTSKWRWNTSSAARTSTTMHTYYNHATGKRVTDLITGAQNATAIERQRQKEDKLRGLSSMTEALNRVQKLKEEDKCRRMTS